CQISRWSFSCTPNALSHRRTSRRRKRGEPVFRRTASLLMSVCVLAIADAGAAPLPTTVHIEGGQLSRSLETLEHQTGVELLFDPRVVSGLQAPAIHGNMSTEEALAQLLAGTSLRIRRAQSGAWIVETTSTAPLAQQDALVTEILVIGRRTQNTDIRRTE